MYLKVPKFGYREISYIKKAAHTRCFWNSWAKQTVLIFELKTTPNVAQLSNQQKWQPYTRLYDPVMTDRTHSVTVPVDRPYLNLLSII